MTLTENEKPRALEKAVKAAQIASVVCAALAVANELLDYPLALAVDELISDGFLLIMFFSGFVRAAWSIVTLSVGGLALLLTCITWLKRRRVETVGKKLTVAAVAAPLIANAAMRLLGGGCF